MTEQQPYDVLGRYRGFELRRYPPHLVAEITVEGSFEGAGNRAFMPLASFINGRNRPGAKVAMTAPVVQEREPGNQRTRIAMTAPVVQEPSAEPGRYVVAFVMPSGYTEQSLPEPEDPRIRVRQVPEQHAAARRFSGRWTRGSFEDQAAKLLEGVNGAGLQVAGPVRYARFDPPWTPWFLRRNEVVVPVLARPS